MTSQPTRTLIVMRHSKAEPDGPTDHDRRLAARGLADAADTGRWAAQNAALPDHVVVSSAVRTRSTWESFAEAAGCDPAVDVDEALYSAGTETALEILRAVPAGARTVMVVGHNPTVAQLVHLLDDGTSDAEVFARVAAGYPTSALAVLETQREWVDLDLGSARIVAFRTP